MNLVEKELGSEQLTYDAQVVEPLASIIVPVYNTREYLPQCLDSALGQCAGCVEIVCVDDGSTDGSLEYLLERSKEDDRISVFAQEHRGAGSARNYGIDHARGSFYHFLDSDDYLEDGILEKAINLMDDRGADVLVFQVLQHDMATGKCSIARNAFREENFPSDTFSPAEMAERLFNTFLSWAHNKVFRADYIRCKGIRFQEVQRTNDLFFTNCALFNASKITVLPEVGLNYRSNQALSSQGTNSLYPFDFYKAFKELRKALVKSGQWRRYRKSFLNEAVHSTMYNLRSQKDADAFSRLYDFMRSKGFVSLGVGEIPGEEYFYREDYERYLLMMATSAQELARLGWERLGGRSTCSKKRRKLEKSLQRMRRTRLFDGAGIGRVSAFVSRIVKHFARGKH